MTFKRRKGGFLLPKLPRGLAPAIFPSPLHFEPDPSVLLGIRLRSPACRNWTFIRAEDPGKLPLHQWDYTD